MPQRPPRTLWTMTLADVWRLLLLSTLTLVCVIAFAASLKPLAEGQLAPLDALKYMGLATVPMLQFALPFGAAFAATLAYHRFASENESTAASAGGVSYAAMLAPAAATGAVLLAALLGLTNEVIPRFTRAMEEIITRDVAQTLRSSFERGESVEFGSFVVHADAAYEPRDGAPADGDAFILEGVVVVQLDDERRVLSDVTTSQAYVLLTSAQVDGEPVTVVSVHIREGRAWRPGEALASVTGLDFSHVVPYALSDDPDYLTWRELIDLRADPDQSGDVGVIRRRLAGRLSDRFVEAELRAALAGEGRLRLQNSLGEQISISGAAAEEAPGAWRLTPVADGRLEVVRRLDDGQVRHHTAASALLSFRADDRAARTLVDLTFFDFVTPEGGGARAENAYSGLLLDNDPAPQVFAMPSGALLDEARRIATGAENAAGIDEAAAALRAQIAELRREITGVQHERMGLSVACMLMTLTGSVMALRLREGLPLAVYLWTFFPALVAVITVSGGERLAKNNEPLGLIVVWSGIAGLAVYTLGAYMRLRRH